MVAANRPPAPPADSGTVMPRKPMSASALRPGAGTPSPSRAARAADSGTDPVKNSRAPAADGVPYQKE